MTPQSPPDLGPDWAGLSVSQETHARLLRYEALLREWNGRMNLVAESTLPDLWSRHFLDSAQLLPLLPSKEICLVDLGSGAGLPGMILAILGVQKVHLIESIGKKARFLEAVAAELAPQVTVHNTRIEAVKNLQADVVTARALTALPELLSLSKPFMGKDSLALFLKGEKAEAELTSAAKYWTFDYESVPSKTNPSGTILKISHVKVLRSHVSKRRTSSGRDGS